MLEGGDFDFCRGVRSRASSGNVVAEGVLLSSSSLSPFVVPDDTVSLHLETSVRSGVLTPDAPVPLKSSRAGIGRCSFLTGDAPTDKKLSRSKTLDSSIPKSSDNSVAPLVLVRPTPDEADSYVIEELLEREVVRDGRGGKTGFGLAGMERVECVE